MARSHRYNKVGRLMRVTQVSGGYGTIKPAETEIAASIRFTNRNINPNDREAVVSRYGLEENSVVFFGEGEYVAALRNGDVIDCGADDRWKILGASEIRGRNAAVVDCWSFIFQKAGARP